jgi:hypothetical protein
METSLRLFGTSARTKTLVAVALLNQSYPREIARVADLSLLSVQRIVDDLERQSVLASRIQGVAREVRLNPSYFAYTQLRELLLRLSAGAPDLVGAVEALRRRPRRARKPI